MPLTTTANTTCNIYRPFGGALSSEAVPCRFTPDFTGAAARASAGLGAGGGGPAVVHDVTPTLEDGATRLGWTAFLDVVQDVDIRDGCTRPPDFCATIYEDGDEVRIPDASGTKYVVIWVETFYERPGTIGIKRAYLHRDTAVWPGP